ncbi:MAG: YgiT-type zinc finger protein, partial [Nanoarchaeota archaeon]|nr:YgiT-type zinc finger protein [Nanoarchaeota archaeon]
MTKCYICGTGTMKKGKVPYKLYGEYLGDYEAEKCGKCGEIFYSEETSRKMTEAAKKKGLWGLNVESKIGQSGTTLDVRLPKKIIDFMNIKKGEPV